MIIKSFSEFNRDNIQESYRSYDYEEPHGKTGFSRWLRGIGDNIGIGNEAYSSYYSDAEDNDSTLRSASKAAGLIVKGLTKGTAEFIDFLSPGENIKSWKDLDAEDIKRRRQEIIKKWEDENINNRSNVTEKDAEDFYKSGVLRGKKYFGEDFTPVKPKSKDQEIYRDYLKDIMNTYYKKTKKKK